MSGIPTLLILIPALPLVATLLTVALGKRVLRRSSHWPTVTAVALSFAASVILVFQVQREADRTEKPTQIGYEEVVTLWTWAAVDDAYQPPLTGVGRDFRVDITLRADPLTAIMLAMVTFVSLLVAVYSIGHMHDDPGYWRTYTYIPLCVFSTTMLVSVSDAVRATIVLAGIGLAWFLYPGRRTLAVMPLQGFARICCWIDRAVIDGLADVCGSVPRLIGAVLRPLQNGMIQFYALAMALGLLVLMGMLLK